MRYSNQPNGRYIDVVSNQTVDERHDHRFTESSIGYDNDISDSAPSVVITCVRDSKFNQVSKLQMTEVGWLVIGDDDTTALPRSYMVGLYNFVAVRFFLF